MNFFFQNSLSKGIDKVIDKVILEGGVTRRGKNWNHVFILAIPLLLLKQ